MQPTELEKHVTLFICYASEDQESLKRLIKHLRPLINSRKVTLWQDEEILAGEVWDRHIKDRLNKADVILLLVSANFFDSKYCWEEEVKVALQRLEAQEARVIPIILSPVDWK